MTRCTSPKTYQDPIDFSAMSRYLPVPDNSGTIQEEDEEYDEDEDEDEFSSVQSITQSVTMHTEIQNEDVTLTSSGTASTNVGSFQVESHSNTSQQEYDGGFGRSNECQSKSNPDVSELARGSQQSIARAVTSEIENELRLNELRILDYQKHLIEQYQKRICLREQLRIAHQMILSQHAIVNTPTRSPVPVQHTEQRLQNDSLDTLRPNPVGSTGLLGEPSSDAST